MKLKAQITEINTYNDTLESIYSKINFKEKQNDYERKYKVELFIPYVGKCRIEHQYNYLFHGLHIDSWLNDKLYLGNTKTKSNPISYDDCLILLGSNIFLPIPNDFVYFKKVINKLIERNKKEK